MSRMKGSPRSHIIAGSIFAALISGLSACSTAPQTKAPTYSASVQPAPNTTNESPSAVEQRDSREPQSTEQATSQPTSQASKPKKVAPSPVKSTPVIIKATSASTSTKQPVATAKAEEKPVKRPKPIPVTPMPQKVTKKAPVDSTATNMAPADESNTSSNIALLTPTPTVLDPATPMTEPTSQNIPEVVVKLEQLPITIASHWILDQEAALPAKNCVLRSNSILMEDGQGSTRVYLELTPKQFNIKTKSNIDLGYEGDGLMIDSTPFELESLLNETSLAFTRQYDSLLNALKQGETLKITLGFWPSWPVSQTYSSTIPVNGFAAAYSAWDRCNKLL